MNAFICITPLHYYLFRSIYKNLTDSEFLIPPVGDKVLSKEYGGGMSAEGLYNLTKDFLKRQNVKISDYGEINSENVTNYLNHNVKNVICPHLFEGIFRLYNCRIIQVAYGIPSTARAFRYENIYLMDLIITYGPESAQRISEKGLNTIHVGNILFDDWFRSEINEEDINMLRRRLDPQKKTILYLPTWDKDSSIDSFIEEISLLKDEYNVIVKLHHCTFSGEANRLCRYLSFPEIIVLGDYFDSLPLYKVSDIVITDGISGATFDALSMDKKILTIGSSILNYGMEMKQDLFNILKRVPFVEDPKKIREYLKKIVKENFLLDQGIKDLLFFPQDGKAGKRAAEAILDEKKYPSIPTLEKYNRAMRYISDPIQRQIVQEKRDYFIKKYYPGQIEKTTLVSKIYHWFFR